MEEYQIFTDQGETIEKETFTPIKIEENENKYDLNIEKEENIIQFFIYDKNQLPSAIYERTMNFKEIKSLSQEFKSFNTFNDFYDYLKKLSDNNKLNIKKRKNHYQ